MYCVLPNRDLYVNNNREHTTKSHSTCSDGSLLSMDSSEMDEDSFGPNSRHSSKLSLHDRSLRQTNVSTTDSDLELGSTTSITAPLSHSAAKHKMAVKPKRTYGAPRRRRNPQMSTPSALPTTLEVNEEVSLRSSTPESSTTRETMTELYSSTSMNKSTWSSNITEQQLKSSSLPPGLALPSGANKLSRSRSNAGCIKDALKEEEEEDKISKEEKKKEESFFGRFLARRSGKKQTKKSKSEDSNIKIEQTFKAVDERKSIGIDEIEQSTTTKSIIESFSSKSETAFSYKQFDEQDGLHQKIKVDEVQTKVSELKKVKSDDYVFGKVEVQEKLKKLMSDDLNLKISESIEKTKKIKSEETKVESYEKQLKKLKTDDNISNEYLTNEHANIIKINENLVIEKHSKKTKSDDFILKTNETDKQIKKIKSDDYILIKTGDSMSLYKQSEERKNSMDSIVRNCAVPRSGPAARQRIQPIDIPASPDSFRHSQRRQNMDLDIPSPPEQINADHRQSLSPKTPQEKSFENNSKSPTKILPSSADSKQSTQNSPESPSYLSSKSNKNSQEQPVFLLHHNSPPKPRIFQVNRQLKIESFDDKSPENEDNIQTSLQISPKPLLCEHTETDKTSKIKIAGLSSYQQKVLLHNDDANTYKSLIDYEKSDPPVSKAHSFRSTFARTDTIDSFTSRTSIDSIDIYDSLNRNEPLSFISHSDSIDTSTDDQKIEKVKGVTVSCINSQILTSVNNSNQVIVNISNDNTVDSAEISGTQLMVTRVQLKREVKPVETKTMVPEFMKIQLNKVDIKPSNVVLSTTNETTVPIKNAQEPETGNTTGNTALERKFSKEDVEIIDKETSEETVEFSKLIQAKTEELNKKQTTVVTMKPERKNSASPPLAVKPFLRRKSSSIELSESTEEKTNNSDHTNHKQDILKERTVSTGDLIESPEPVILRRKSSASAKKEKESSDEPELMKVFARRSLKLKDSEAETLSQQVMILVENSQSEETNENSITKSRDSDKENELIDSPQEERKKFQSNTKETKPLNESKLIETTEVTLRKPINNKIAHFNKTPVIDTQDIKKNNTKSYIDPKNEKPKIFEKNINRTTKIIAFNNKEVEITKKADVINNKIKSEVISTEMITNVKNNENENDEYVPMFKRISQRKEEWEQRAQQALKKTVP